MSTKPKIMVFQLKELIYTIVFVVLAIALILLLIFMFFPKDSNETNTSPTEYTAGVYKSSLVINSTPMEIEIVVDKDHINSISLANTSEAVATMYPLVQNSIQDISKQIVASQSLDNISYVEGSEYTYAILLDAIRTTLDKAVVSD